MKDFSLSKAESQHREMLQRRTEKIGNNTLDSAASK
jgi:hypothetical protein